MNQELVDKYRACANDALMVQNACNLSGVVRSFHRTLQDVLWPVAHEIGEGTHWVNTHPITRAYIDKLASLAGTQSIPTNEVYDAFTKCESIAAGEFYLMNAERSSV